MFEQFRGGWSFLWLHLKAAKSEILESWIRKWREGRGRGGMPNLRRGRGEGKGERKEGRKTEDEK